MTTMKTLVVAATLLVASVLPVTDAVRSSCSCAPNCLPDTDITEIPVPSTVVTNVNSLLPEGSEPDPSLLDGTVDANVYLLAESTMRVSFLHEGAGYRNTMGYFLFDENDVILSETVLFPDLSYFWPGCLETGDTVSTVPLPSGARVGFFIVANGYNGGRNKYYSFNDPSRNPDKKRHVVTVYDTNVDRLIVGFEDLYNLGDRDYNDATFMVEIDPPQNLDRTNMAELVGEKLYRCESGSTVTKYVTESGTQYALLDGTDPDDTAVGCQSRWYTIPSGWSLALDTPQTHHAIAQHPWGTGFLILDNGRSVNVATLESSDDPNAVLDIDDNQCIGILGCDYRVLISRDVPDFDNCMRAKCTGTAASTAWVAIDPNFDVVPVNTDESFHSISSSGLGGCEEMCVTRDSTLSPLSGGGFSQTLVVDPAIHGDGFAIGVFSRASGVTGVADEAYSIYVDVTYDDGSTSHGVHRRFSPGTHDWEYRRANVLPPHGRSIERAYVHVLLRGDHDGTACFSSFEVVTVDFNFLTNPSFVDQTSDNANSDIHGWFSLDSRSSSFSVELDDGWNVESDEHDEDSISLRVAAPGAGASAGAQAFIEFDEPIDAAALHFGGHSKCVGLDSPDAKPDETYSIYLDVEYANGRKEFAHRCAFDRDDHDWELCEVVMPLTGALRSVQVAVLLRNERNGTVWFDRPFVSVLDQSGRPAVMATSYGDPHLVTFDGTAFDMQAVGEFVIARDSSFLAALDFGSVQTPSTPGFDAQIRTAPAAAASIITAVALRYGCGTVEISVADADDDVTVRSNGGVVMLDTFTGASMRLSSPCPDQFGAGSLVRVTNLAESTIDSGSGDSTISRLRMSFGASHTVDIVALKSSYGRAYMRVDVRVPTSSMGKMSGLFGNYGGDGATLDFVTRDGVDVGQDSLYEVADSWRVTDEESLFHYAAGESTADFSDFEHHLNAPSLDDFSAAERREAEDLCVASTGAASGSSVVASCMYDVLVTGDASMAGGSNDVAVELGEGADVLERGSASTLLPSVTLLACALLLTVVT